MLILFEQVPRHRLSNAEDENGVEEDSAKPKIKRFRKPRRSQLEDNYPPVIQVSRTNNSFVLI